MCCGRTSFNSLTRFSKVYLRSRACHTSTNTKHASRRRVVCTGMGVVCPLGAGVKHAWKRLVEGDVAVTINNLPGFDEIPSKVCALVPTGAEPGQFNPTHVVGRGEDRYLSRSMVFALAAADEALNMAQWNPTSTEDKQRTGVAVGCGMADLAVISQASNVFQERGHKRMSPFFIPSILTNMAAGHISIRYGFQGPNHSVSTACTTGTHAIGDSMRMIRNGDADVMVCGGSEASVVPIAVSGFARARALSTKFTDSPHTSSRPFDKNRDGFVMGEGAGVLVLEEYEHAKRRKATIYGEILGYGLSGDAYHMTTMHEDGIGGQLCMQAALRDAGAAAKDVGYVNAHATSTPIGDAIENKAIKAVFDEHAYKLKVSSCKGAIGHLLGAAGSVESVFTMLSLYHGTIPPTMNVFETDEGFDLDYVANVAQSFHRFNDAPRIALKNSFGFGGTNASLCLGEVI